MALFARKDATGRIVALSRESVDDGRGQWLEVDPDAPEVADFIRSQTGDGLEADTAQAVNARQMDLEFIRVLEDLINVLVDRGVIRFTDLPPAAQAKLSRRQSMRERIRKLSLLDEDDRDVI